MNNIVTIRKILVKLFCSSVFALILLASVGLQGVLAQNGPLSLAEVLTGLQSQSGGFSLSEKNSFITGEINKRGVTFRLSEEIESELRRAGAGTALVSAVRIKTTSATPTRVVNPNAPPIVEFDKIWVDYNVVEKNQKGMRVHAKFTLKNLKDEPLKLTVRVQKENGDPLKTSNTEYANKGGQLAVFSSLKPGYISAIFQDQSVFIPYSEFNITPGQHELKLDADIIYPDGDMVKHLTLYPFTFTKPGSTPTTSVPTSPASVKLEKIWFTFNEKVNGVTGMTVHTKTNVYNLKDKPIQVAVGVETESGTKIEGVNMRSSTGQLTGYYNIVPKFDSTILNDARVFIPYSEINILGGVHNLRVHVDVIDPATNLNLHVGYENFRFTKPNPREVY